MVDRSWKIAIHESGHLVIARQVRLPDCGEASIVMPGAHAHFSIDCGAPSICALLGGAAAEVELLGTFDADGFRGDAGRIAERLHRDDALKLLWSHTRNLLRQNRQLIEHVARHLHEAETLDAASLDALCADRLWLHE